VLAAERYRAELILVDDGSTDRTWSLIEDLVASDRRVHGVRLARNAGHQPALMCGISLARGAAVLTLDADLQHPPEQIPAMLDAWRRGYDVVHMHRRSGPESALRVALAYGFYALFNAVSDVAIAPRATDFRLLDRSCIDALSVAWDRRRFLRAAARGLEGRHTELAFDASERFAGRSRYTLPKLLSLAVDAVVAAAARTRATSAEPRVA
jgi:dolichol-phosphate mannosyltransferase